MHTCLSWPFRFTASFWLLGSGGLLGEEAAASKMKISLAWREESIIGSRSRLTRSIVELPLIGRVSIGPFEERVRGRISWVAVFKDGSRMTLEAVSLEDAKTEALQRILGLYQDASTSLATALQQA